MDLSQVQGSGAEGRTKSSRALESRRKKGVVWTRKPQARPRKPGAP